MIETYISNGIVHFKCQKVEKEALLKVAAGKRDETLLERGRGREEEEGRTRGSEKRDERSAGGWRVEREGERRKKMEGILLHPLLFSDSLTFHSIHPP